MSLFGKPKQLKHLDRQLSSAQMGFGIFGNLPASNQQHYLQTVPKLIADAVTDAVRAGHAAEAKAMLDAAGRETPKGATAEQWRTVLARGVAELSRA